MEGPGQDNPDRSEGLWGRATAPEPGCFTGRLSPDTEPGTQVVTEGTKAGCKPNEARGMPGAGLTRASQGKALAETLALKPSWGKLAVRNFRGGDGNGARSEAVWHRHKRKRRTQKVLGRHHRAIALLAP